MKRLSYVLIALGLYACAEMTEVKKGELTFYFTSNVPARRHAMISNYIVDEIKELKLEELDINDIKIDSVPFSIILYVPYSNKINQEVKENFKSLANLLTEFDFNDTPINIVLTDERFNPKVNLPYDKDAVSYLGKTVVKGRVEVNLSESAASFSAEILEEVLKNRIPELYKGKDSVKISVNMVNDIVKIDFNFNRENHNIDTLKRQLLGTDRLFFDLLFERRTVLFHVRDNQTKELITVLGLKGE